MEEPSDATWFSVETSGFNILRKILQDRPEKNTIYNRKWSDFDQEAEFLGPP
jgi:hypothetical protein